VLTSGIDSVTETDEVSAAGRTIVVRAGAQGQRLDVMLAAEIAEVSRSQLARHIAEGAVTVNGERVVPSRKVRAGDVITWTPPSPAAVYLMP
jgi:23S rRNA-/tRNA-specific pseudouridylate synthase